VVGLFIFGYVLARIELRLFRPGNSVKMITVLLILAVGLSTGGRRAAAMMLENGLAVVSALGIGILLQYCPYFRNPSKTACSTGAAAHTGVSQSRGDRSGPHFGRRLQ